MTLLGLLLPAAAAALLTAVLAPLTRKLAFAVGAIDRPGERKIHSEPVPRLGGLAVVASMTVIVGLLTANHRVERDIVASHLLPGIIFGLLPILITSIIDDVRPLTPLPKILAQLAGASIAVFVFGIKLRPMIHIFGRELYVGWLAIPISILWIVGVTNAFNLIDGLDGLSAGLAFISSVSLGGVSLLQHSYGVATLALILAGALLGFLPFNVYPARMFLGDSGAASVGYILACIVVGGISPRVSAGMAILVPVVVMGLPIADTLISLCRRIVRAITQSERINILAADRQHIHHRLLALGLHQKDAVLVLYAVGIALSAGAIASMFMTSQAAGVLLLTMITASAVGISRLGYDEFALIRRGVVLRYYDKPMLRMSLFVVFIDLAMSVVALYMTIVLKYDDFGITTTRSLATNLLSLLPAITLVVFCAYRIYWQTWRNAGLADLFRPLAAALSSGAVAWAICHWALADRPPATFFVLYALILGMGVASVRASYRLFHEWTRRAATENADARRVAIYAAGVRGAMALQNLLSNESYGMRPVGFIDDDPMKAGKYIKGYRIFGSLEHLPEVILKENISAVIVANRDINPQRLETLNQICRSVGTTLLTYDVAFRDGKFEEALVQEGDAPVSIPYLQPRPSEVSH